MSARLALVTGASSGIGATFARVLSAIGLELVLVARRKDRLEALAAELPNRAECLVADLASEDGLARVEDRIRAADTLDVLVNNAGFGTLGRFWDADLAVQEKMLRLHVTATMRLTHAAIRGMVGRRRGAVINVASVAGFAPAPGNVSYASTKAWIITFTEALDLELKSARSPVRVQALCPGFTHSEFHDTLGVDPAAIPGPLWTSAEFVVAESFRGLARDQVIVVPGAIYKALVALLRFIPRPLYRAGSLAYSRRMKRDRLPQPPADRPSLDAR